MYRPSTEYSAYEHAHDTCHGWCVWELADGPVGITWELDKGGYGIHMAIWSYDPAGPCVMHGRGKGDLSGPHRANGDSSGHACLLICEHVPRIYKFSPPKSVPTCTCIPDCSSCAIIHNGTPRDLSQADGQIQKSAHATALGRRLILISSLPATMHG